MVTLSLSDIKSAILAEALWGTIVDEQTRQEGNITRHTFQFFPKDTPIDTGKHNSDLSWLLSQDVLVEDEGGAGESAYYEGLWVAPLYNAFLRWLAANIAAPKYVHSWTFLNDMDVRFTELDVSSGYAVNTQRTGTLTGGELVVT